MQWWKSDQVNFDIDKAWDNRKRNDLADRWVPPLRDAYQPISILFCLQAGGNVCPARTGPVEEPNFPSEDWETCPAWHVFRSKSRL